MEPVNVDLELASLKALPRDSTEARQKAYLRALALLGGNAAAACRHLSMSSRTPQVWRKESAEFKAAEEEALGHADDALESEARRRAYEGVSEPVFYQGQQVGFVQRYSDALLMFLLRGRKPKVYGTERSEVNVSASADLVAALRAGRKRVSSGE